MKGFFSKFLVSLLCVMLVFNAAIKPKKSEAIAPIAIWVAEAIVVDVVATLGWKYVAKPAYEAIKKKIVKKVTDNPDKFDFTKKKVDLKKDGSLIVPVTPTDKAKIAKLAKDEYIIIADKHTKRKEKSANVIFDTDMEYEVIDPYYATGVRLKIESNPDYSLDNPTAAAGVARKFIPMKKR